MHQEERSDRSTRRAKALKCTWLNNPFIILDVQRRRTLVKETYDSINRENTELLANYSACCCVTCCSDKMSILFCSNTDTDTQQTFSLQTLTLYFSLCFSNGCSFVTQKKKSFYVSGLFKIRKARSIASWLNKRRQRSQYKWLNLRVLSFRICVLYISKCLDLCRNFKTLQ